MQLKRETEYFLRVLYCIGKLGLDIEKFKKGTTVDDISIETGVPKIAVIRICNDLEENRIITEDVYAGRKSRFFPNSVLYDLSLKEIIEEAENSTSLFAVFEKNTELYCTQRKRLESIQNEITKTLAKTKMKDLLPVKSQIENTEMRINNRRSK